VTCGALAGCFDIEAEVQFNPNETGDMKVRLGFDREMGDVLDFVQTLAKFSDNPAAAVFSSGVCSQAALVQAPAEVQRHARVRQYMVGNQLYCEASVHLPQIEVQMPNPDGYGMFSFERTGPRRWRIALDLERLPDLTPFMMMGMMATLESDPRFGARIRGAEAMEIVAGAKKANVALMAMLMRGRHIKYTIRAPRIVSSIGAFERGDQAVVFRFKFDELMEMVMDETARQGKVYAVEVAY
jgi:hypothetical protein